MHPLGTAGSYIIWPPHVHAMYKRICVQQNAPHATCHTQTNEQCGVKIPYDACCTHMQNTSNTTCHMRMAAQNAAWFVCRLSLASMRRSLSSDCSSMSRRLRSRSSSRLWRRSADNAYPQMQVKVFNECESSHACMMLCGCACVHVCAPAWTFVAQASMEREPHGCFCMYVMCACVLALMAFRCAGKCGDAQHTASSPPAPRRS